MWVSLHEAPSGDCRFNERVTGEMASALARGQGRTPVCHDELSESTFALREKVKRLDFCSERKSVSESTFALREKV
jgi:hypothetical protein